MRRTVKEMKKKQCFKKGQTAWNKGKKLTDEQNAHKQKFMMQKSKNNLTALTPQALKLPVNVFKKCPKMQKKGLRYELYIYEKNGSRRSISSTKGLDDLKQKDVKSKL